HPSRRYGHRSAARARRLRARETGSVRLQPRSRQRDRARGARGRARVGACGWRLPRRVSGGTLARGLAALAHPEPPRPAPRLGDRLRVPGPVLRRGSGLVRGPSAAGRLRLTTRLAGEMLRGSMQSSPWVGALLLFGTAGALSVSCVDDDYSVPADPRAEGGASDGGASDGGASGAAADGVSGEGGGLGGAGGAAGAGGGPFEGGAGGDSGREASGGTSGGAAGAPGSAGAAAEGPGLTQGGAAGSGPDPEPPPDAGGAGGAPEDDCPCADDPCNGRGECSAPNGEVLCTCDGPYLGARRETPRIEPLGQTRSRGNGVEATQVRADGSVVVGWTQGTSTAPEAFGWEAGAVTRLGTVPGGIQSKAFAVGGDGRVVVSEADALSGGSGT